MSTETWSWQSESQKQDNAITINGNLAADSIDCCNTINDHFCSAGEVLATNIIAVNGYDTSDIDNLYPEFADNNWSFKEIEPEDIVEAVDSLPNKKTTSMDKIPMSLFKATKTKLAPLIALSLSIWRYDFASFLMSFWKVGWNLYTNRETAISIILEDWLFCLQCQRFSSTFWESSWLDISIAWTFSKAINLVFSGTQVVWVQRTLW